MSIRVKICGLREQAHVAAAVEGGAAYVGFVFFPKSPRFVDLVTARALAVEVPPGVAKVALTVDADDAALGALTDAVPLDMLQLQGSETPERVAEVRARFGLPVMKAMGVAVAADLDALDAYAAVADQILLDAKAPKGAARPGGNGVPFDWRLIAGRRFAKPWMLGRPAARRGTRRRRPRSRPRSRRPSGRRCGRAGP
jgi:phosphoribosylanthranilate isomerase